MQQIKFALRALRRDFSAGELRVLALALIVSVASVTAVGFFTDRIGRAMMQQAADVLAADIRIQAGQRLPTALVSHIEQQPVETAHTIQFPSVALTEDEDSHLVAVKAVSAGYPLRGELQLDWLAPASDSADMPLPAPGTVWVDQQLRSSLQLEQGQTVFLGAKSFQVERVITFEPDRGQNVFEMAPRIMLNIGDLDDSELLGEGSRARFALLVAGEPAAVNDVRKWVQNNHATDVNVQTVKDGGRQVQRALERAETFLGLAAVVTVLLASAAIALAVRQFALRQTDASAVMRTLGASRAEVTLWLALRLVFVALLASAIGIVIGWLAQLVLADLLREWFRLALPEPGLKAPLVGLATAFVTLAGFGLLPIVRAGRISVVRVLQRDYQGLSSSAWLVVLTGLIAGFCVVLLQSGNLELTAIVMGGVLVMLALFALFGRFIIRLVRAVAGRRFRLSVAGLQRRAGSSVVQLSAFALGIMALLLISIVRVDVLQAWEQDLPADAPNVFAVNIQPSQVDSLQQRLIDEGIDVTGMYPLIRARLVATNGESLLENSTADAHARRHGRREYNLTWSDELPAANTLVEGRWWTSTDAAEPLISIESEWAEHMGLKIGDQMTFKSAGQEVTGTILNTREVDWESFQVNFFVVGNEAMLGSLPATYVTSFHNEDDFGAATNRWVREFPGMVTLDIGAIVARVKSLMDRAALAVEYVFMFTLAAGVVVLLAAVQSSQAERIRESALLRALGASHHQIRAAVVTEFAILGGISGFLAAFFATIIAWSLSRFVLELPFHFNYWLWIIGIVSGVIGISIAGYLATRRVLHAPPLVALREQ